jgi:hypothetical protein
MRMLKALLLTLSAALLCVVVAAPAKADLTNEKTVVTFDQPVRIPGQVLQPGTYVFELPDNPEAPNLVQIWNEGEDHLIASVLTVADYQSKPSNLGVFNLDTRPGDSIKSLTSWFYGGKQYGQEFVYPEHPGSVSAPQGSRIR